MFRHIMACFHPLSAYQLADGTVSFSPKGTEGKNHSKSVRVQLSNSINTREISLPCGQCIGCRLERSRQWAVRCMHESQMHKSNSFVTLTYDDDHVPADMSLRYVDFQKFVRAMRRRGHTFRYYMCGEYGETYSRPHYHACLFGFRPLDLYPWRKSSAGFDLYRSPMLEELWDKGNVEVGEVTFESAAYVARYILKKITGPSADLHYEYIDEYGEIHHRVPEFTRMSLKPGIGATWYEKYKCEVFPRDRVVVRGRECKPPRYYRLLLDASSDLSSDLVAFKRYETAVRLAADNTDERLKVREVVARARVNQYKRGDL